jgi:hypothetical protein
MGAHDQKRSAGLTVRKSPRRNSRFNQPWMPFDFQNKKRLAGLQFGKPAKINLGRKK